MVNNSSPSNKYIIYSEIAKINSKQDEQTHDQRCDLSFYVLYIDVTRAVLGILGHLILIWFLDRIICSSPQKLLGWHLPVEDRWHISLNLCKFFLHQSQWECHHWLCGNNLTTMDLGQFLICLKLVGKRVTHAFPVRTFAEPWGETALKSRDLLLFFTWVVIKTSSSLKWHFCTIFSPYFLI